MILYYMIGYDIVLYRIVLSCVVSLCIIWHWLVLSCIRAHDHRPTTRSGLISTNLDNCQLARNKSD